VTSAPTLAAEPVAEVVDQGRRAKLDQWICWWVYPFFYTLFGIIFVPLGRVMPPPRPNRDDAQIAAFFHTHATSIKIGFALLMLVIGLSALANGVVAYQMKRMSVPPIFAYSYIVTLAVGAMPGCFFVGLCFVTAVYRPDRDPHLLALLYDLGMLTFVGSLGCFAAQYLILAFAILLDRNDIFPRWFAYVSIWNVMTEVLAAPVFIFKTGPVAWNGVISFWMGTAIFGVYLGVFIVALRNAILRQDLTVPVQD
jgi:hypothetical protein